MLATWWYSDIASTPTASPSLRMLSDSDAALVGEGDRGEQHPFPGQRDRGVRPPAVEALMCVLLFSSLDNLTT